MQSLASRGHPHHLGNPLTRAPSDASLWAPEIAQDARFGHTMMHQFGHQGMLTFTGRVGWDVHIHWNFTSKNTRGVGWDVNVHWNNKNTKNLGCYITFTGTTHPRLLSLLAPGHIRFAMRSSLAPAHRHDATLSDLILPPGWGVRWGGLITSVGSWHRGFLLRYEIFSCTCTPT